MPLVPIAIDAQKLLAAYGTPEFPGLVASELAAHWRTIPLEKACENGGFPDRPQFHGIEVAAASPTDLSIRFGATFQEIASPGCAGQPAEQPRFADFALRVTPERSTIEHRPTTLEPEF